jgi:hypothetical protein
MLIAAFLSPIQSSALFGEPLHGTSAAATTPILLIVLPRSLSDGEGVLSDNDPQREVTCLKST